MFTQKFNQKVLILLSAAFSFSTLNATASKKKDKKPGSSSLESPAALEALNFVGNYIDTAIKNGDKKPVVQLIPVSKELMDLVSQLLGLDKLEARFRAVFPSVQAKLREASEADRAKLEKDPEVKELRELSAKTQMLSQQAELIKDAAIELFKAKVIALNKNVLVVVMNAELSRSDDQTDDNHILIKAQQLYKFCVLEAHASISKQIKELQEKMNKEKEAQGESKVVKK